jgi:predicted glycosyltransferase
MEQYIRANRARELGFSQLLTPEEAAIPQVMAAALRKLPDQPLPSRSLRRGDLAGLDVLCDDIERLVADRNRPVKLRPRNVAEAGGVE